MENTRSNVGDFDDVDDVGVGPFFSSCRRCIDAAKVSTPRAFWWSLLLLLLLLLKLTTHATLLLVVVVVVVIVLNVSSSSSKRTVVIECRLAHNTTNVWCSKHDTRFGHKSIDFSLSLSLSFQYHNTNKKRRRRRRDPQQKPTKLLREQHTPLFFFFLTLFFFGRRQKVFRCVVQKHKTRDTHTHKTKQNKTKKYAQKRRFVLLYRAQRASKV